MFLAFVPQSPAATLLVDGGSYDSISEALADAADGGERWITVANDLPPIYAVRFG